MKSINNCDYYGREQDDIDNDDNVIVVELIISTLGKIFIK